MATRQSTLDDLVRQLNKLIGLSTAILERYSRLGEEFDSNRLANEEIRELLKELIVESSRWADSLNNRMDRLERYTILSRMVGSSPETVQIEGAVSRKHIEDALNKELTHQQKLVKRYQDNIFTVQERIARYGETTANLNELEEYQTKLDKALEAMRRIREQLHE